MNSWRLLLTRPAQECAAQAQALAGAGIFSRSLPLLAIEPLAGNQVHADTLHGLDRYQAIIVVSKPAARLLTERLATLGLALPTTAWFSVGAGTAQVLEAHGVTVHFPPAGDDSEALLGLAALRQSIGAAASRVLIVRGEGGRELLAERLAEQGASVEYLELYRRRLPDYPAGTLARLIDGERLNGLVVSSGQGLEHLQYLAGGDWPRLSQLPLFVPSPRVAARAREAGAHNVVDCRGASTAALMAAVQRSAVPAS